MITDAARAIAQQAAGPAEISSAEPPLFRSGAVQLKAYARALAADETLQLDAGRFGRYLQSMEASASGTGDSSQTSRPARPASNLPPAESEGDEPVLALRGRDEWYYDKLPRKLVEDHTVRAADGALLDDAQTIAWLAAEGAGAVGRVVTVSSIPWRVLDFEVVEARPPQALLLSEYVLGRWQWRAANDARFWSDETGPWLRKALNSRFFDALSAEMRSHALTASWPASRNRRSDLESRTVQDCVSLLSIEEVEKYLEVLRDRVAVDPWGNRAWWWLRSPGYYPGVAAYVDAGGYLLDAYGFVVSASSGGVRPALRLNLES
jgi:hypothetical protein